MSLTNIVLLGMMVILHLNIYRAAPRPKVCLLFPVHTVPYLCPHQTCFLDSICPSVCRFVMYTCTLTLKCNCFIRISDSVSRFLLNSVLRAIAQNYSNMHSRTAAQTQPKVIFLGLPCFLLQRSTKNH